MPSEMLNENEPTATASAGDASISLPWAEADTWASVDSLKTSPQTWAVRAHQQRAKPVLCFTPDPPVSTDSHQLAHVVLLFAKSEPGPAAAATSSSFEWKDLRDVDWALKRTDDGEAWKRVEAASEAKDKAEAEYKQAKAACGGSSDGDERPTLAKAEAEYADANKTCQETTLKSWKAAVAAWGSSGEGKVGDADADDAEWPPSGGSSCPAIVVYTSSRPGPGRERYWSIETVDKKSVPARIGTLGSVKGNVDDPTADADGAGGSTRSCTLTLTGVGEVRGMLARSRLWCAPDGATYDLTTGDTTITRLLAEPNECLPEIRSSTTSARTRAMSRRPTGARYLH
ncbi:hypothetical protein Q5752_006465 [Cryptotrichosporon argae]